MHSSILAWKPIDRGSWRATVHGAAEWTRLSTAVHTYMYLLLQGMLMLIVSRSVVFDSLLPFGL